MELFGMQQDTPTHLSARDDNRGLLFIIALRAAFFASFTITRKRILCSHEVAISRRGFTRFSERLANAPACHTVAAPQTDWYFTMPGTRPQLIFWKAMLVRRLFKNGWAGLIRLLSSTTHTQQSDRVHMQDDIGETRRTKDGAVNAKCLMDQ